MKHKHIVKNDSFTMSNPLSTINANNYLQWESVCLMLVVLKSDSLKNIPLLLFYNQFSFVVLFK